MKLGLALGYSGADMRLPIEQIQHAEALGYDSIWTAEAYGSDAFSPLAYAAAQTERIRLGTGVIQLAARTPANAAMTAATIDALAGHDRVILGIGVSGPQIVEGWYGQPWGRPNPRIRDYVAIIRKILAREAPVTHDGPEISLPYDGPGSSGLAKPLRSILHMNRASRLAGHRYRGQRQADRRDRRRLAAARADAPQRRAVCALDRRGLPPRRGENGTAERLVRLRGSVILHR